jgi:hypothetical protein
VKSRAYFLSYSGPLRPSVLVVRGPHRLPLRNRTIALYQFDEHLKNFIRDNHLTEYKSGQRCFLLAASGSELSSWMASYMTQIGFHAVTHQLNDFVVIQFRRD